MPWQAANAQLTLGPEILRIGATSRATGPVFGEIVAVDWLHDGRIVVIDGRLNSVQVFDRNGALHQGLGGPGLEAGFYHVPTSATVVGRTLLVLDIAAQRITAYHIGDTLTFAWTQSVEHGGSDLCAIGSRVFVLGSGATVVREFRLTAHNLLPVRSFGQPFSPDPSIREMVARGRIACSHRFIAVASVLLPFVWIYDASGNLLSRVHLAHFRPYRHERLARGTIRTSPAPGDTTHRVAKIVALNDSTIGAQVEAIDPRGRLLTHLLGTHLITLGKAQTNEFASPILIWRVAGRQVLGSQATPFAMVSVRSIR